MKIALLGFPAVGKSTLFGILTGHAEPHPAPGRTGLQAGVTQVPDPRLDTLAAIFEPKKITPATVEFWDPAAAQKPGRGASLPFGEIRPADGFLHIVRAFDDPSVPSPRGGIDPKRDVAAMEAELLLADLAVVEKRLEKLEASLRKRKNPDDAAEEEVLVRVRVGLDREMPVRALGLRPEMKKRVRGFSFLTDKPILGVVNVGEKEAGALDGAPDRYGLTGGKWYLHDTFCAASAEIEAEVAQLEPADAAAFRSDLGLPDDCRERLLRSAWVALDQATFFTWVEGEVRAWNVPLHTPAQRAASRIHSDMERGFIRAEVIALDDLVAAGSIGAARERGTFRMEGKDYEVAEGDVITFRFNV